MNDENVTKTPPEILEAPGVTVEDATAEPYVYPPVATDMDMLVAAVAGSNTRVITRRHPDELAAAVDAFVKGGPLVIVEPNGRRKIILANAAVYMCEMTTVEAYNAAMQAAQEAAARAAVESQIVRGTPSADRTARVAS